MTNIKFKVETVAQTTDTSNGSLATLSDVDVTGVSDGQVLKYDAESETWKPGAGGSGGDADTLQGQDGSYYLDRANHTGSQAASTITQDATHRFASDTEKATWNGKVDAAYVIAAINALVNGAPAALDTLKEIADQLANDEDAVAALTSTVSGKESNANKATNFTTINDILFPTLQAVVNYLDGQLAALTKASVGLGNVNNTSDADKPVSTAQAAALDLKANAADIHPVQVFEQVDEPTGGTYRAGDLWIQPEA